MTTREYVIDVPGNWDPEVTLIDLETVKVPAPPGFVMANGERLRQRWSVAMAGVATGGLISIVNYAGTEESRLKLIGRWLMGSHEVRYGATREFDEMICKGRFTNARRAHESEPYFPAVPGACDRNWCNVGVWSASVPDSYRAPDIPSRDIPAALASGPDHGSPDPVMVHLLRDVAELILTADPTPRCESWCYRVLTDFEFALAQIFG